MRWFKQLRKSLTEDLLKYSERDIATAASLYAEVYKWYGTLEEHQIHKEGPPRESTVLAGLGAIERYENIVPEQTRRLIENSDLANLEPFSEVRATFRVAKMELEEELEE